MEILENPVLSKMELDDVVKIHMETFAGFFLTFLGKGFLRQMYKGFIAHENSGLIVAKSEKGIVGVLAPFFRYTNRRRTPFDLSYKAGVMRLLRIRLEMAAVMITTDAKLQKANPKQYALAISDHYGKMEDSNDRIVNQVIVKDVLERVKNGGTNQLQMGAHLFLPGMRQSFC